MEMGQKLLPVGEYVDHLKSFEKEPITRDRVLEFCLETAVDLLTREELKDVCLGRAERVCGQDQETVRVLGRRPPVQLDVGQAVQRLDGMAK